MTTYPKLIFTCQGDGIYVHGAGSNPMAEVRRLDTGERVGAGPLQLMSIVAHIDLDEWEEVIDEFSSAQSSAAQWPALSSDDRALVQRKVLDLLIARRKEFLARYEGDVSAQHALEFILDTECWKSLGLSDQQDQGFRHLTREEQVALLEPLLKSVVK